MLRLSDNLVLYPSDLVKPDKNQSVKNLNLSDFHIPGNYVKNCSYIVCIFPGDIKVLKNRCAISWKPEKILVQT